MILKKIAHLYDALPVHIQRSLRFATGWLCIGLGVIGVLLPLLPGIPFLLLGSWLLGWSERLRPWVAKWRALGRRFSLPLSSVRRGV